MDLKQGGGALTNQFRKFIKTADPATLTPEDLVDLLDLYAAAIKLRDSRDLGGGSPLRAS
jgi:hypothetical protein